MIGAIYMLTFWASSALINSIQFLTWLSDNANWSRDSDNAKIFKFSFLCALDLKTRDDDAKNCAGCRRFTMSTMSWNWARTSVSAKNGNYSWVITYESQAMSHQTFVLLWKLIVNNPAAWNTQRIPDCWK